MHTLTAQKRHHARFYGLAMAGTFLVGLASHGNPAHAVPIPVLDPLAAAVYTSKYSAQLGPNVVAFQDTTNSGSPVSLHPTYFDSFGTSILGLDIVGSPLPSISASASTSGFAHGSVSGELTYQFRIETSSGIPDPTQLIPVAISFKGHESVNPSGINSNNQVYADASIEGLDYKESYTIEAGHSTGSSHSLDGAVDGSFTDPSFDVTNQRNLHADTLYSVHLTAQAGADDPNSTASAFVDPFIAIALGYKSSYHLVFSPGILNTAAVTPIPAALPLFTSGLGALGLLGWRKRRKAVSRAA